MAEVVALEVTVRACPDTVWRAIVEQDRRRAWWSYLDLEARTGGRLVERWSDAKGREVITNGRVLEATPPARLRCTWRDGDWPAATEVELSLCGDDDVTRVRVRHAGWERLGHRGAELLSAHRAGWGMHLAALKRYLESSEV